MGEEISSRLQTPWHGSPTALQKERRDASLSLSLFLCVAQERGVMSPTPAERERE
jgi:hypothetical protein